jgi:hypothetical protein
LVEFYTLPIPSDLPKAAGGGGAPSSLEEAAGEPAAGGPPLRGPWSLLPAIGCQVARQLRRKQSGLGVSEAEALDDSGGGAVPGNGGGGQRPTVPWPSAWDASVPGNR